MQSRLPPGGLLVATYLSLKSMYGTWYGVWYEVQRERELMFAYNNSHFLAPLEKVDIQDAKNASVLRA